MDESKIQFAGCGDEIDKSPIRQANYELEQLMRESSRKNLDKTEGEASVILYKGINSALGLKDEPLSLGVLDDPGFWRYLSLVWFWKFAQWRQWEPPQKFDESKHLVYIDGEKAYECVVSRMYLRVASLGGLEYSELASCLDGATDFWRSHLLRVRTSSVPSLTRAFVRFQRDMKLNTTAIRAFAKKLNQAWANFEFIIFSDDEASEFLDNLYRSSSDD